MLNFNDYRLLTSNKTKISEAENKNIQEVETKANTNINNEKSTILINNPADVACVNKSKFALPLAITGAISAAIAITLCSKKISALTCECSKLKKALEDVPNIQNPTTDSGELKKAQEIISELQEKIKRSNARIFTTTPLSEEGSKAVDIKAEKYRELISSVETIYEDAQPPKADEIYTGWFSKLFPLKESSLPHGEKTKNNFIENLIEEFNRRKKIEIPLIPRKSTQKAIESAKIKQEDLGEIAKAQKTSLKVAYGKKVQWSDEKVARDILQNFYDGNDHNLDGIGFLAEELPNGHYRIRISGNGVFDYDKLRLLGNTTKTSNLADAGGFGEGSKVVIANMLANGNAEEIIFRSADWELIFDGKGAGEIIRTTLNKSSQILDGNCIEFETPNKPFVEKLINALNYFKHKNNPDFQDLTFENDNFGFRILNPKEKGNFYLTQRFEFEDTDAWENGVEGLNIIFKKRPDPDKYETITGHTFNTGRDRSKMTCDDIYDLIRCYSKDMSDEDIINSILATKKYWLKFEKNKKTPIKSLLCALLEEAKKRNIGIDFSSEKICCTGNFSSAEINKMLLDMGYGIISDSEVPFRNISMPTSLDIKTQMSTHKALKPTKKEAQKLKILEMATDIIQKYFSQTYVNKFNSIMKNIEAEDLRIANLDIGITSAIKALEDLEFDDSVLYLKKSYFDEKADEIIDIEKFNQQIFEYIQKKAKLINAQNIENKETENFLTLLFSILENNSKHNEILKEYVTQLKNLSIISEADISKPRFIFDRKNELGSSTLGEAIIKNGLQGAKIYKGHWVDRTYLGNGNFSNLLATWLHEISHKSGGDGTADFTYKLTDIIESLLSISADCPELQTELMALQKVFNEIK